MSTRRLAELIQPEIETLLVHAPISRHQEARGICEEALQRVESAVLSCIRERENGKEESPQKSRNSLELTIEHTLTPLFICIRPSHYSMRFGQEHGDSDSTLRPVPSARLEEYALRILKITVSACGSGVFSKRERAFWEILGRCVSVIGTSAGAPNPSTSEESKQSCLEVCVIMLRATQNISSFWVEQGARSKLGHILSILLSLTRHERSRSLRLSALSALECAHESCDRNTLACFYPGVCSSICKLLTGDISKLGKDVTYSAIRALTSIIKVVFRDIAMEEDAADKTDKDSNNSFALNRLRRIVTASSSSKSAPIVTKSTAPIAPPTQVHQLSVAITSSWVAETATRTAIMLRKAISNVSALTSATSVGMHWKVRLAALKLADTIVNFCSAEGAAHALVPVAIEIAVTYLHDHTSTRAKNSNKSDTMARDNEDADNVDKDTVASFAQNLINNICLTLPLDLWRRMQEHFRSVIMSLPRVARSEDESHLVVRLNVAAGYAEVLGSRIRPLFDSDTSTTRIFLALCQCLEIHPVSIVGHQTNKLNVTQIINQNRIRDGEQDRQSERAATSSYYDIPFYHVKNAISRDAVSRLLATISRLVDGSALLEFLTSPNSNDWRVFKYRAQCAYLANILFYEMYSHAHMAHTLTLQEKRIAFSDIRMICRRTVESNQWCLPTGPDHNVFLSKRNGSVGIAGGSADYNTNAILVGLLVQRIGDAGELCEALGLNFRRLLLTVTYPLLEKMGDENPIVSQSALASLRRVALHCGYDDVGEDTIEADPSEKPVDALSNLLKDNMDYLVDIVCARLSAPDQHPGTAAVIRGIFNRHHRTLDTDDNTSTLLSEIVTTLLSTLDREVKLQQTHGSNSSEAEMQDMLTLLEVCREIVESLRQSMKPNLDWNSLEGDSHLCYGQRDRSHVNGDVPIEEAFVQLASEAHAWQRQVSELLGPQDVEKDNASDAEDNGDDAFIGIGTENAKSKSVILSIKEILLRCTHFLSATAPLRIQMCCLETIDAGIRIMAGNESELLPLVAKLWPSVRGQAKVESVPVATNALRCVATIAKLCGDFIKSRFQKEVWPTLKRSIRAHVSTVLRKRKALVTVDDIEKIATLSPETGDESKHQGFRAQLREPANTSRSKHFRALLRLFCILADQGMLDGEQVIEVAKCCCALLGDSGSTQCEAQSPYAEETKLASKLLEKLMNLDGDSTWWVLATTNGYRCSIPDVAGSRRAVAIGLLDDIYLSARGTKLKNDALKDRGKYTPRNTPHWIELLLQDC